MMRTWEQGTAWPAGEMQRHVGMGDMSGIQGMFLFSSVKTTERLIFNLTPYRKQV
jgi:hypothetical protein